MIQELLNAAESGDLQHLKKLLTLNRDNVNLVDEHGFSVAILAAKRNDLAMIKLVAEFNADFKQKSKAGQSASDWAEIYSNQEMIDFINKYNNSSPPKLRGTGQ